MLASGHSVYRCRLDLSALFRRLISEVAWPIVTKLCHMFDGNQDLYNSVRNLGGPSLRNLAAKNIKILARFRTTLRLDREYLRNATRHRPSENGIAKYGRSRTSKLNSVYFGLQTANNRTGVLTHPTGGHQAGHCHASSFR